MDVDFGVEVTRPFESAGEVYATETPAGLVAWRSPAAGLQPDAGFRTIGSWRGRFEFFRSPLEE